MDEKNHSAKQRDRPRLRDRLAGWFGRWSVDILLAGGALLVSAGAGWIYPPAGLIAGGALLMVGGGLLAKGGGGP